MQLCPRLRVVAGGGVWTPCRCLLALAPSLLARPPDRKVTHLAGHSNPPCATKSCEFNPPSPGRVAKSILCVYRTFNFLTQSHLFPFSPCQLPRQQNLSGCWLQMYSSSPWLDTMRYVFELGVTQWKDRWWQREQKGLMAAISCLMTCITVLCM